MNKQSLFDLPETLSPKLAWMQKHEVRTHKGHAGTCDLTGDYKQWLAWTRLDDPNLAAPMGEGDTEEEAIDTLTLRMGWEPCPF